MGRHLRLKKTFIVIISIVTLLSFSTSAYAYTPYSYGYVSASVEIEDRTSYDEFHNAKSAWNATATLVWITEVPGSGNSWISDDVYTDTWNGQYDPVSLQYIFWGRATKFNIKLNRTQLVDKSSNFKQSVIVHELGHAFCLGDNPPESPSIMRYDRDRNTMITPQQDDIDGVNAQY